MKKTTLLLFLLLTFIQADSIAQTVKVTYETGFNGKVDPSFKTIMTVSDNIAQIRTEKDNTDYNTPILETYLYFDTNEEIKTAILNKEKSIYTIRNFELNKGLTFLDETDKVAGYNCKKAKTIINSNTIEIWYTTKLGVKGSMQPHTAIPEGVVLKIVKNGQYTQTATKVEKVKQTINLHPSFSGEKLNTPAFNYRIQQSKVIAVNVFDHESIYFRNIKNPTKLSDTEVMRFANGSIVLKKVKLPTDNKGYSIFAELTQYSEGDAYDRTGTVFAIPTNRKQSFLDGLLQGKDHLPQYTDKHGNKYEGMVRSTNYLPPVELLRFYTSFGVRGYNHIQVADYNWPDSILYKQEVTDYAQLLKGEVWIGTWIGNYSKNGHNVTLDIKYYPEDEKAEKEVYPLFATVNILEMAGQSYPEAMFRNDSLTINFETKTDLENAYIRYTSTGHGGWGGGDEFNPKLNELFVDNTRLIAYTPWREDCGSYRNFNPASGNFSNGLSSSDLSRSGWCPGMTSYPVIVHIGNIKAGKHQMKVAIPVGDPEGSSRSYWCISGVLVGNK